jgi:hypothetical protein
MNTPSHPHIERITCQTCTYSTTDPHTMEVWNAQTGTCPQCHTDCADFALNTGEHLYSTTIDFDALAALITNLGHTAIVEQTGGGVATIMVGEYNTHDRALVAAGPGWFNGPAWTQGRGSFDEFFWGRDDDGESTPTQEKTPRPLADIAADIAAFASKVATERLQGNVLTEGGDWVCPCGNEPHMDGFFPYHDGAEVEPDADGPWDGVHYFCAACFRIINQNSGAVVDQVSFVQQLEP